MTISIINGSPKLGSSTSGLMIEYLVPKLSECKIHSYHINKAPLTEMQLEKVRNSDSLVFAFPLYIDSIPAHLLKQLITLETQDFRNKNAKVYSIVTSGFYEGKQNHFADNNRTFAGSTGRRKKHDTMVNCIRAKLPNCKSLL